MPNNVESLQNYFSQVSLIDHGVGRIRAALDRLDLSRDTIVIYTSDHGFSLGHNGVWGHGAASFPASAHRVSYHIPLIMAGGPVENVGRCDALVSQIDLFPTLAGIAGSEATPSLPSPARDLAPILSGGTIEVADAIFLEQEETRAIRTTEYLYAARFPNAPSYPFSNELYDLTSDPREKENLINHAEFSRAAKELHARVKGFFETYSVPKYDLWKGGTAKSHVTFPKLWEDSWGPSWAPETPSVK